MGASVLIGLAAATLASEDAALVAAGALVGRGEVDAAAAVAACAAGILAGDWLLWVVGRASGFAVLDRPWLRRWLFRNRAYPPRAWLESHGAVAILASRFVPGTRLPLYLAAGACGMPPLRFMAWTALAVALWTPVVVFAAAGAGEAIAAALPAAGRGFSFFAAAILLLVSWRGMRALVHPSARRRAAARLARWTRWEFWPMWLFYAPVAVWVALLALRYRGVATITAANPGLPDGGVVGESKFVILSALPAEYTVPAVLISAGGSAARGTSALAAAHAAGWTFPLILKPDVGQRGTGVRLVRDEQGVRDYLAAEHSAVLLQPFHEGPFEAGVFYYRHPAWPAGRILSLTDKAFPVIVGDGRATVAELIWAHRRYRLQADLFLQRHAAVANRVLAPGERLQLAVAGNHAQGATFHDGSHLWTPELEARIDAIARSVPGFFIGRFDIRYRSVQAFRAGRDLAIVELNGATAEATSLYDPGTTLFHAYRLLFRQWRLVFAIGAANRARGAGATPLRRLVSLVRAHLAARPAFALSD